MHALKTQRLGECRPHFRLHRCCRLAPLVALTLVVRTAHASPEVVPDAVILVWKQAWTQNADGSQVYRETRHVKLNNDRANGEFADPRISFDAKTDAVKVVVARTRLANGSVVDVPAYSRNEVGLTGASPWPAFAGRHQMVLTMSAIEPGCVVELEYEVARKAGAARELAADIRLDSRYPVVIHAIEVSYPSTQVLHFSLSHAPKGQLPEQSSPQGDGGINHSTWTFENLPASPEEPQSPPWQQRCPRLAFTTSGASNVWLADRLGRIDSAVDQSEMIRSLAKRWSEGRTDSSDKLRGLQEKLAATFNFVNFEAALQPSILRPASAVLQANYGVSFESAAALQALARAAGIDGVQPALLINDTVWQEAVPEDAAITAAIVVLDGPDGGQFWHPEKGRIHPGGQWSGHSILFLKDGKPSRMALPLELPGGNRAIVRGRMTVAADGSFSGSATVQCSGGFVDPEVLRTADAQRTRAEAILQRVVPDTRVTQCSVNRLAEDTFEARVDFTSSKPLEKAGQLFHLALTATGPAQADVLLPLSAGRRETAVRLTRPLEEEVLWRIDWPAGWSLDASPIAVRQTGDAWSVEQKSSPREHGLDFERRIRIQRAELTAQEFSQLRDPLNRVHTDAGRTMLLRLPSP